MVNQTIELHHQDDYLKDKTTYISKLLEESVNFSPIYFSYQFIKKFKKTIEPMDDYAKKIYDLRIKLS